MSDVWKGIAAKVDRRRALVWGTALLLTTLALTVAVLRESAALNTQAL